MISGIFINRLLLKSPLADAPQVDCYTLLITKLGTEIIALTLRCRFDCATIVADSAIELNEFCLPHTYILCSFALFFYPFLNLDSHLSCLIKKYQITHVEQITVVGHQQKVSLEAYYLFSS